MEVQALEKRLLSSRASGMVERRVLAPWIMAFARPRHQGDVLEVGCGGRVAHRGFRGALPSPTPPPLSSPFASFDIVISLGVWHHVGAWEKVTPELDAAHEAVSDQIAASVRPADGRRLSVGSRKTEPDQRVPVWGGVDSNHRPTDYESAALTD
jgi:hypothetical protein